MMKHSKTHFALLPITIIFLSLVTASLSIAATGSLISNSNFASDLSHWTSTRIAGSWIAEWSGGATDGCVREYVSGASASGSGYLCQEFTNNFTSITSATLTFRFAKSWSKAKAEKQEIYVDIVAPGGIVNTVWSDTTITETKSWSSLQAVDILDITSTPGQYAIRLRSSLKSGADSKAVANVYFDDVQITIEGTINNPPAVQVMSPNGGEIWYEKQKVSWRGADPDGNTITYEIYISTDEGANWVGPIATVNYQESPVPATHSYELDTTVYTDTDKALIKIVATDGVNKVQDISDNVFGIVNTVSAPVLISPQNGVTISNTTPTLDWKDVILPAGLKHYTVKIATDIGFTSVVYTTNVSVSKATPDALSDGTYYWKVRATDQRDRTGAWSDTFSFVIYTYAPTITSFSINSDAKYTTSKTVTLSTTAVHSTFISFSTDGTTWSPWEQYGAAMIRQIELPEGDEIKTVYVRVKDALGHIGATVTDTIVLDTTPPSTVYTITGDLGEEGQYKGSAVVNFIATDATSGVDYIFYKIDDEEWTTGDTAVIIRDGEHTVSYFAVDKAGNKEAVHGLVVKIYTPITPVPYLLITGIAGVALVVAYITKKRIYPKICEYRRSKYLSKKMAELTGVKPEEIVIKEKEEIKREKAKEKKKREETEKRKRKKKAKTFFLSFFKKKRKKEGKSK